MVLGVLLLVIVGVPFVLRPQATHHVSHDAPMLVIITPHVQQIRYEFGLAFSAWHEREYGQPARIDWRTPGGTSEIRKLLTAEIIAAARRAEQTGDYTLIELPGEPTNTDKPTLELLLPTGAIGFDIMFGGGSYEHEQLKLGVTLPMRLASVEHRGRQALVRLSRRVEIDRAVIDEVFGENRIGSQALYDPELYWVGTALSGFGIVYNRDVLRELGLLDPTSFEDLTDPRLAGWVALADPRQSGSITTTFDSILGNYGWDRGWRILREMTANARYFTNSSTKPPIDISQGEAGVGLAIDFYGRTQAHAVMRPGETADTSRVGYTDPKGATYVDADPVSVLHGGPNPALAERFVVFCLTPEAQALWQFPVRDSNNIADEDNTATSPTTPIAPPTRALGPLRYELRRMPIRRDMYHEMSRFIDKVNPFEIASDVRNPGWRTGIEVMMAAFGIETATHQRAAWRALTAARADPTFPSDILARMESAFYAWPTTLIVHPLQHPAGNELSRDARTLIEERRITSMHALRQALRQPERGVLAGASAAVLAELGTLADAPPARLEFTEQTYRAVRDVWRDPIVMDDLRIEYRAFFAAQYRHVVRLHDEGRRLTAHAPARSTGN